MLKKYLKSLCIKEYNFLAENNIIYDLQFCFRQKFSTSHALINLAEYIRQTLDEGYSGCGIFVDLQKFKKKTLWPPFMDGVQLSQG